MSSRTRPVRFTLSMKGSISVICPRNFSPGYEEEVTVTSGRFEASVIHPDKTRPKPTPQRDQPPLQANCPSRRSPLASLEGFERRHQLSKGSGAILPLAVFVQSSLSVRP